MICKYFLAVLMLMNFVGKSWCRSAHLAECGHEHFLCSPEGPVQCIPDNWVCDDFIDCYGGQDETDCPAVPVTCDEWEFRCANGQQCFPNFYVCDGDADCDDGSDEEEQLCLSRASENEGNDSEETQQPSHHHGGHHGNGNHGNQAFRHTRRRHHNQ